MSTDVEALLDPGRVRRERAMRVKQARPESVKFPRLKYWNYDPCSRHEKAEPGCEWRQCGGDFYKHQKLGITWLYLVERGILADVTGAGKTNHVLGLAALLKERGGLTERMVVVCQPAAVLQWRDEALRWCPKIAVEVAVGSPSQRRMRYGGNWDVLVIGYQMMLKDIEYLARLEPKIMVSDDVDPMRSPGTATWKAFNRLSRDADRVVMINATPLQIRLQEMWATSVPVGGLEIFGSERAFERRYVRQEMHMVFNPKRGTKVKTFKTVGYKNGEEYRAKLDPIVLRRSYEDLDDVEMPEIAPPETVWLELGELQRKKYEELQGEVLVLRREKGKEVKHVDALTRFTYGQQVCSGLPALKEPDGPGASTKLDWLMDKLTGDWYDQKIIAFIKNVGLISALEKRCKAEGIGVAKIWGADHLARAEARRKEQERFWNDPECRVVVGNSAMERSLNLQNSNIVVNVDTLLNPARMTQILGRSRRAGSRHSHIWSFTLLTRDTQEEAYPHILRARQGIIDYTWQEETELFGRLSPEELLQLIRPN